MVVILVTAYLFVSPFLRQSSTEKHYSREQDEEVSHLNLTKWSKSKKKKKKKDTQLNILAWSAESSYSHWDSLCKKISAFECRIGWQETRFWCGEVFVSTDHHFFGWALAQRATVVPVESRERLNAFSERFGFHINLRMIRWSFSQYYLLLIIFNIEKSWHPYYRY